MGSLPIVFQISYEVETYTKKQETAIVSVSGQVTVIYRKWKMTSSPDFLLVELPQVLSSSFTVSKKLIIKEPC